MLRNKKLYILLLTATMVASISSYSKANSMQREIVDTHKEWRVKFNHQIKFDDNTKKQITIKDEKGNLINSDIIIDGENKDIVIKSPDKGYDLDKIYTLHIGNNIYSKDNTPLKEGKTVIFKVKSKDKSNNYKYKDLVDKTINDGIKSINKKGVDTAWEALALKLANKKVPNVYVDNIKKKVHTKEGLFDGTTEYEKVVLGLISAGENPLNIEGINLLEKIYNNEDIESLLNAQIFALIAFDSKGYKIPDNALWTRDKLIKEILEQQTSDGGWDFAGIKADPDMTAMAITALAPYKDRAEVKQAVDKGINVLQKIQRPNGSYACYKVENCESISQVILGLCANGIDPTDSRFVKNGKTMIDALMKFKLSDGRFAHIEKGKANDKSTEQALLALQAYKSFKEKSCGSIYIF